MMKYKKIINRLSFILVICVLACGASACASKVQESPPAAAIESASELIAEADKLYAGREDIARVRAALTMLRRARAVESSNYEAAWRIGQFAHYLGAHTTDEAERDKAFREGVEASKAAAELQPQKPEGHFWLGANYGGVAQHSTLAGLTAVDDITTEMEIVLKLDEGFQGGSAYLALGQLYLEAPRMLGGDSQKALAFLEKGLRFGENNALLRLRLAEAYVAVKRNEDARKQLDAINTLKPDPNFLPEYKDAVAEAQKLRDKIQ